MDNDCSEKQVDVARVGNVALLVVALVCSVGFVGHAFFAGQTSDGWILLVCLTAFVLTGLACGSGSKFRLLVSAVIAAVVMIFLVVRGTRQGVEIHYTTLSGFGMLIVTQAISLRKALAY